MLSLKTEKQKTKRKIQWILDEITECWHERWDLRLLSPIVRNYSNFLGSVGISNLWYTAWNNWSFTFNNILGLIFKWYSIINFET